MMYTLAFGLQEPPFNLTPDPRFFYTDPGHAEAYASLLYGIRERKGCIALIGEAGTGKTTLLHRVMSDLEKTIHTAFFYNTTLTFDELLDFICSEFRLSVKTERRLEKLLALKQFLLARRQEGGTGVLIIDEAHLLADSVLENLRLLSNMETVNEKLLQLILVGQPQLETKLNQPELRQLKQRMVIRCCLDHLKARDVGPFIYHRLRIAGCDRKDVFTLEAIQRIAVYSGGIPRLISTICDNALLTAYATMQPSVSSSIIEEVAQDLRLTRVKAHDEKENPKEQKTTSWSADQGQKLTAERYEAEAVLHDAATSSPSHIENTSLALAAALYQSWPRWATWVGVGFSLVFMLYVGSGALFPQQTRARLVHPKVSASPTPSVQQKEEPASLENAPPSQNLSTLPAPTPPPQTPREEPLNTASPPQASDFHSPQEGGQLVTIARGDTISTLILKMYGTYNVLAFDLLKECNPHIEDLDRIAVGTQVWLPFLTRDTLLRRQVDGSYHLIIGAFHSTGEAERLARLVRRRGYNATITQQRMSGTRLLYRVELEGLQDLAAVDKAWDFLVQHKLTA